MLLTLPLITSQSFENRYMQRLRRQRQNIDNYSLSQLLQIKKSNVIYSFGIVILEVLLGERIVSKYIRDCYEWNNRNEDFVMNIPPNMQHYPEVYSIVEKCLLPFSTRPTIHQIRDALHNLETQDLPTIRFSDHPPIAFSYDSYYSL